MNIPKTILAVSLLACLHLLANQSQVLAAPPVSATFVRAFDTSQFSPPSPDPSGLAFLGDPLQLPSIAPLLISDAEVDEIPALFMGVNEFEMDISSSQPGGVLHTHSTTCFTKEPSGAAFNPSNGHFFFADDNTDRVYEVDPGGDGNLCTADDTRITINTQLFGSSDPEGLAFAPGSVDCPEKALYIADGSNAEVYKMTPGPNGIFNGVPPVGDDQVTHFDTIILGAPDPNGLEFDPVECLLYIVSNRQINPRKVVHVTPVGTLVRNITIAVPAPYVLKRPDGLATAPSSVAPHMQLNLYVADRELDNNVSPGENDGKVFEFSVPPLPPGNQAPNVSAGPDQTVDISFGSAALDGTVADDGPPPLTTSWSKASGPGTVTFAAPAAQDTTASFSATGNYVLRLTASDGGGLSGTDNAGVSVVPKDSLKTVYVSTVSGGNIGSVFFSDEDIIAS